MSRGSVVWACYRNYERRLETAFLQLDSDQTTGSHQKYFFEAKIWIEVSKVSKQLQAKQTADDVAIDCKWLFYKEII